MIEVAIVLVALGLFILSIAGACALLLVALRKWAPPAPGQQEPGWTFAELDAEDPSGGMAHLFALPDDPEDDQGA